MEYVLYIIPFAVIAAANAASGHTDRLNKKTLIRSFVRLIEAILAVIPTVLLVYRNLPRKRDSGGC